MIDTMEQLRSSIDSTTRGSRLDVILPANLHLLVDGNSPLIIPANTTVKISSAEASSERRLSGQRGYSRPIIDGQGLSRLFDVRGRLELVEVTLARGRAQFGGCLFVFSGGAAKVVRSLLSECRAVGDSEAYGDASGGAVYLDPLALSFELRESTIRDCDATNMLAGGKAQGGATFILGGEVSMYATDVLNCTATAFDAAIGNGGALYVAGGTLLLTDQSKLEGSQASGDGGTLFMAGGATTYKLPAPPGHWVAGLECLVYREGCPRNEKGSVRNQSCIDTAAACSRAAEAQAVVGGFACQPLMLSQPCDWVRTPGLIGSLVQVLPQGPLDGDYPRACAPGVLGSNESAQQVSPLCAGLCPAGEYQDEDGAMACKPCEPGHFCKAGAAAALPCAKGTYSNATTLQSAAECTSTDPGFYAPTGSVEQKPCLAGSFAREGGHGACEACPAGKYRPATSADASGSDDAGSGDVSSGDVIPAGDLLGDFGSGEPSELLSGSSAAAAATACFDCHPGFYCPEGASAPLPCEGGTFSNANNLTSADECSVTDPGSFAPTGSTAQMPCAAGTFTSAERQDRCLQCPAGQYQDEDHQTACQRCNRGFYCKVGAAQPTPCPGGTSSNATGLASGLGCVPVPRGFWAPTGSPLPIACPASGFACPGALAVDAYARAGIEPPGSQPILLDVGSISTIVEVTREMPSITTDFRLDLDLSDFEEAAFKTRMATAFDAPSSLISLQARSGSVILTAFVSAVDDVERDALATRIAALDNSTLSAALGASAIRVTDILPLALNVTRNETLQTRCPAGHWCTAGRTIACRAGTYNNRTNADDGTACMECPAHATSPEGSVSIEQCVCTADHYDELEGGGVRCKLCPSGSQCDDDGIALSTLPIKRGYYRHSNASVDVRRCPDAAANCADAPECKESTSGCRGTVDGGALCYPKLTGVFCRVCASRDDGKLAYYKAASSNKHATCTPCEDTLGRTLSIGSGAVLVLGLGTSALRWWYHHTLSTRRRSHLESAWRLFAPLHKLKLLIGGAMITTKISSVYDVEFPAQIRQILSSFSIAISLGLSDISTPLTCLGLDGFHAKLLFFTLAPPFIALTTLLATLALLHARARWRDGPPADAGQLIDEATPWLLRLLFIAYPLVRFERPSLHLALQPLSSTAERVPPLPQVTNVAFEAFPCHELAEGGWLKADVAIKCDTPDHDAVKALAWVAIVLYPVGLLCLSAGLLYYAREAIRTEQPTAFSKAIQFIYAEYTPHFFWWELVEMLRRLILVGLMVVIESGRTFQLALASMLAIIFLFLQLMASPYREAHNGFLASVTSFSIVLCFLCSIFFKYSALLDLDGIQDKLSSEQRDVFVLRGSYVTLTWVLGLSVLATLLISIGVFFVQLGEELHRRQRKARSARARRLRVRSIGKEVAAPPIDEDGFHLFLSHVWGTGQDPVRIIKQRLLEMIPELRVFLDVDGESLTFNCACTPPFAR